MGLRHKLALSLAVGLAVLGIVVLSMPFQRFLIEQLPPQNNPFRSFSGTWGIGLAPYLYCFLPASMLVAYVCVSKLWVKILRWADYKRPPYL